MVFEEFKRTYLKGMAEDEDGGNVSPGEHWGMHVVFEASLYDFFKAAQNRQSYIEH